MGPGHTLACFWLVWVEGSWGGTSLEPRPQPFPGRLPALLQPRPRQSQWWAQPSLSLHQGFLSLAAVWSLSPGTWWQRALGGCWMGDG